MHVQEPDPGDNCEDGIRGGDADGVDERENSRSSERDGKLAHGTEKGSEVSGVH